MLIVFATSGLRFNGDSLKQGSLGGSETALIYMARALAKRGHEVRVFCECDRPGLYDGVHYFAKDAFLSQCAMSSVDVLVASRWYNFLMHQFPVGLRVLWMHDILVNHQEFMAGQFQTDLMMPLSEFHVENYCEKLPDLRPLMWKTSNGVDLELVQKCRKPKIPGKLIYTSRPERGLHFLLKDILPKILERRPDVKLYFANYDTSSVGIPDYVKQILGMCDQIAKANPNHIIPMGHLPKESLYHQISSSQLHLYPTAFPEISCITAMEAQACGTPIVTTNGFALKETVGSDSGVLIDGTPEHASYVEEFAKQVCDLLDDQDRLQAMSEAGPKFIQQAGYVWDTVAERWETKFLEEMDSRWQKNTQRVIQQLEHNNDLATAEYVARKEGLLETADRLAGVISKSSEIVAYTGSVENDFAAAMPMFQRLNALLEHKALRPQRIFDYSANDVCYGLMLAKMFPASEVVIRAVDIATAARLKQYAVTAKLSNVKVLNPEDTVLLPAEKEFDLLFLGDVIDDARDPIDLLSTAQARYLSPKGFVLVSTRYGSRSTTKFSDCDRLWNFEFGDIRSMLADSGASFDAVFSDEAISDRGELVGHWCWLFNKTTKLSSPSSVDKLRRTRPYESLAVCMIAKNEGDWLSGCLKTVKSIADKIVLVDTGSTDSTVRIANEYGAEVRSVVFDNFSQARNESIRDVAEDWILWVDADERIAAPDRLRRYLSTKLFEGFGIRQNHLMLDIGKTFDVPVRLLRNRPYHKFTGLIHEHCERVDRKPFDDAISPVLVLNDVDIVHYGYMNERVRRQKCSNRNMKLLIRDVQESAPQGRMLTWVLVIRDYLNFVKWSLETTKGAIVPNSRQHMLLCAVIATYRSKFGDGKHRYDPIARPMYQEALQFLGKSGLTYGDRKHPPFEIGLSLAGAFGGLEDKNVAMQGVWFLDHKEFVLHLQSKGVELAHALGASSDLIKTVEFKLESEDVVPDPVKILSTGLNIIPTRVA